MSTVKPPLIRERLCWEREIADEVTGRLEQHGFAPAGADPLKDGLVQVFAHYCQILSERLNRVPESHHRAFIDMLGAVPAPAVPARVPLSFTPVGSTRNITAVVPRSTQVAASPANGSEAVIFETPGDLTLIQAELKQAVAVDTRRLIQADASGLVARKPATSTIDPLLMEDAVPLERAMHISQPEIIGLKNLGRLRLKVDLNQDVKLPPDHELEWGIRSEEGWMPLPPESDTTGSLTRSGELEFLPPQKWPSRAITDETGPWLTCRLRARRLPLSAAAEKSYTGIITGIELSGYTKLVAVPPTSAFDGGIPLDVSRDFFPLGERPRFGEVFYLLSESFALPGTRVTIDIKLTNPAGGVDAPIPPVSRKGNPRLRWETHTVRGWVALECVDGTHSLTQDGEIELLIPHDARPTAINAVTGAWVRARMVSGHYGADKISEPPQGLPQIHPPSIATISLTSIKNFGPLVPERLVIESELSYEHMDGAHPFNPFPSSPRQGWSLYLGLEARKDALAGRTLSLYAIPCPEGRRVFCRDSKRGMEEAKTLSRWQFHTETGWRDCIASDSTSGFRNPGIIELDVPEDISIWHSSAAGLERQLFWIRIAWDTPGAHDGRETDSPPCLRRILLNTILGLQTLKLKDELAGSSNGRPGQIFHTLRKPVIGGVKLEVREPGGPVESLSEARPDEEFAHNFGSMKVFALPPRETWAAWHEVEDFYSSGSRDRHYVLDRLTGRIMFGDGRSGAIPPKGANNIRLREYHTGGGRCGNQPAGAVAQMRTTIPYVDSVTNLEPATGGQDQENPDARGRNSTAWIRHRDRAVCMDDYADLARKASPEVAYAACSPARDLLSDPDADGSRPGVVSVIVVPHGSEPRPQPSFELVKNVKSFLDGRRPVAVDLIVLGPEYVGIGVVTDIVWKEEYSIADAVSECRKRLDRFLHPVSGGLHGQGWQFGQLPHASDLYPLLGEIEGLDHIRSLELSTREERAGLLRARNFLVCSGNHEIRVCRQR